MPRLVRNSAILAKIETTIGTDPTPTVGSNAVLISNLSCQPLNSSNIDRSLIRSYFGASEQIVGSSHTMISFDVEFQSSGSMTTPTIPAWDALLQACGYVAGVGSAGVSVTYDLQSTYSSNKTVTIYYYDDGVLHKLLGARGKVSINANIGERPTFSFSFMGLYGGVSAASNGALTLSTYMTPLAITDVNTGAMTLGCTYSAGALSSGTEYVSAGVSLDLGNVVNFTDLLGTAALAGQSIDYVDRQASGSIKFDLTAANEVTFMGYVTAMTTLSLGFVHGTTAGYKMLVFCPKVQFVNPSKQEINGRRLIGFDLRVLPSASGGNDEIKIVAL